MIQNNTNNQNFLNNRFQELKKMSETYVTLQKIYLWREKKLKQNNNSYLSSLRVKE